MQEKVRLSKSPNSQRNIQPTRNTPKSFQEKPVVDSKPVKAMSFTLDSASDRLNTKETLETERDRVKQ